MDGYSDGDENEVDNADGECACDGAYVDGDRDKDGIADDVS